MTKFLTKKFETAVGEEARIDAWLNSLVSKEFGMMVVGYVSHEGHILITVKQWRRIDVAQESQPETWQEPTINVDPPEEK